MRGRQPLDRPGARRARLILTAVCAAVVLLLAGGVFALITSGSGPSGPVSAPPAAAPSSPAPPAATGAQTHAATPAQATAPAVLRDQLSRFLTAFYTRPAGATDADRARRIQALVPPDTWRTLDLLVPGIPAAAAMTSNVEFGQLHAQTPRTANELYVTVPVSVTTPGSEPVTYQTASLWQNQNGTWVLLQFRAVEQGGESG
jgi:hypothetical protein